MARFTVFCLQEELMTWIVDLCKQRNLLALLNRSEDERVVLSPDSLVLDEHIYQFYLVPAGGDIGMYTKAGDFAPRDWGLITVRPGGLCKRALSPVLLPSELHGARGQFADADSSVRQLKRKVIPLLRKGVVGRNVVYGGEATYADMFYTSNANELFESGVLWKQFPDDNAEFRPALE